MNNKKRPVQHNLEKERAIWSRKKIDAVAVAQKLWAIGKASRSFRMKNCADTIISDICGKCEARYVIRTYFCRDRLCSVCSWRRSCRLIQRLNEIITTNEAKKRSRYLLLTLTVRNVAWNELANQIKTIMESWHKLNKRIKRASSITGWVRVFEVTRSQEHGDAHPHLHILLQVPPEYFACPHEAGDKDSGLHYHKKDELIQQWAECLGVKYQPSISIHAVKDTACEIERAVAETARYIAKKPDIDRLSDTDFRYYAEAVRGVRSWSSGGRMKMSDDDEIEPFLHGAEVLQSNDQPTDSTESICKCKQCGGRLFEMREVWSNAGKAYTMKVDADYNSLKNQEYDETQAGGGNIVNLNFNNNGGGNIYVGGDVYGWNAGKRENGINGNRSRDT